MKLLYYLAAIGGPHLEEKLKVLTRNLLYINQTLRQNFSIAVNCYSHAEEIAEFVRRFPFLDAIYFHYRPKSVLAELWLTNPYMERISGYDTVLFVLDDVSISKLNIPKLVGLCRRHDLDMISPAVIGATHAYMQNRDSRELALTNNLEVYCMVMTPAVFKRYLSINTFENKWTWGVDLLFGHLGIKTGIYYGMNVFHLFPGSGGKRDEANELMLRFLAQHGFRSAAHASARYPPIKALMVTD